MTTWAVSGSSKREYSISAARTSDCPPIEANREMPSPLRAESVAISVPSCPDWVTTASEPGVKWPQASSSSWAESTSPKEFGPMRRAPAAMIRAARSSAFGTRAEMMRKARTPAARASSTAADTAGPGMEMTSSSGIAGSSDRCANVGWPWIEAALELMRWTRRRCAPVSAPAESQNPHLLGSFDAPTTATLPGSKNASMTLAPVRCGRCGARCRGPGGAGFRGRVGVWRVIGVEGCEVRIDLGLCGPARADALGCGRIEHLGGEFAQSRRHEFAAVGPTAVDIAEGHPPPPGVGRRIREEVGHDGGSGLSQPLRGLGQHGHVRGFDDEPGADGLTVVRGDRIADGGGDEHVGFGGQPVVAVAVVVGRAQCGPVDSA